MCRFLRLLAPWQVFAVSWVPASQGRSLVLLPEGFNFLFKFCLAVATKACCLGVSYCFNRLPNTVCESHNYFFRL